MTVWVTAIDRPMLEGEGLRWVCGIVDSSKAAIHVLPNYYKSSTRTTTGSALWASLSLTFG